MIKTLEITERRQPPSSLGNIPEKAGGHQARNYEPRKRLFSATVGNSKIKTHIVLKRFDGEPLAIELNLHAFTQATSYIHYTLAHESHHICLKMIHVEFGQVRFEGDLRPIFVGLALCDLWFCLVAHVVCEHLRKYKQWASTIKTRLLPTQRENSTGMYLKPTASFEVN